MFAGNFAPNGWSFCQGQLLSIAQNPPLFNLIGTTYGGDGQSTFALPDLQGRVPVHIGSNGQSTYVIGQTGGVESLTLTNGQIPSHTHPFPVSPNSATASTPVGTLPAAWSSAQYTDSAPTGAMSTSVVASGGSQPHDNMPPFLVVSFIISLFGVYPSQT